MHVLVPFAERYRSRQKIWNGMFYTIIYGMTGICGNDVPIPFVVVIVITHATCYS
ncbi:MAG: hypothetical protein NVS4B1_26030 [Ktedonobacteraceae bacterium]